MFTALLWLLPVALMWLRFPKESRASLFFRYLCALFVAWCAFGVSIMAQHKQVIVAAEASGDWETADRDTGAGALVLFVGWAPSFLYVGFLGLLRHGYLSIATRPDQRSSKCKLSLGR